MRVTLLLVVVALITLSGTGEFTKAASQTPDGNASVSVGQTNADFIDAWTDDPPGNADPGSTKDVATCTAEVVSEEEVRLLIDNAYPSYTCTFTTVIMNGGTLPERRELLEFDVAPELTVTELTDLTGVVLGPGDTDVEVFTVHVEKVAEQNTRYDFTIRKPFSLFTGDPTRILTINGAVCTGPSAGQCLAPPPQRKVVFVGGIDSEASCNDDNDGLDQMRNKIRDTVLNAQTALAEPAFSSDDFIQFSWGSQDRCSQSPADVAYEKADTCIGIKEAANNLDDFIKKELPPGTVVDVVGHSLGGMTVAYWAASQDDSFLEERVHSIMTLDSPLKGAGPHTRGGWVWRNLIHDSVCGQDGNPDISLKDIKKETDSVEFFNNTEESTEREAFVAVNCTPGGDTLPGSWKVFRRRTADHECAWNREDARNYIALALLETLVDDKPGGDGSLEPSPSYSASWTSSYGTEEDPIKRSVHSTRASGASLDVEFEGGEIVLLYRGPAYSSRFAPKITATVDGDVVVENRSTQCRARCNIVLKTGLDDGTHRAVVEVVDEGWRTDFRFDGFAVCPVTGSSGGGRPGFMVGNFGCGQQ